MIFHYSKDNKAICGRNIESRYLTDDWSMVDCKICLFHKDKSLDSVKKFGKGKYR
jgi:hypothetical protein